MGAICTLDDRNLSPTNSLKTIDMNISNNEDNKTDSHRSQRSIPKFDHQEDIESDTEFLMNLEKELNRRKAIKNSIYSQKRRKKRKLRRRRRNKKNVQRS